MATLHNSPEPLPATIFDRSVHEVALDLIGATLLVGGSAARSSNSKPMIIPTGRPQLPGPYPAQRGDVRTGRGRLRVPVLRHPLVPQLRLRKGRQRQRRADPRPAPTKGLGGDAPTPQRFRREAAVLRPGRLCEALGVTHAHNGRPARPAALRAVRPRRPGGGRSRPRIGLTKAVELPWRYGLAGSAYLSRPFQKGPWAVFFFFLKKSCDSMPD